jgi:hypothetical protein
MIPGSPLPAISADSTSWPKLLKSIPVASLTRECLPVRHKSTLIKADLILVGFSEHNSPQVNKHHLLDNTIQVDAKIFSKLMMKD